MASVPCHCIQEIAGCCSLTVDKRNHIFLHQVIMSLCSMACRVVLAAATLPGDTRGPENAKTNTAEESGNKGNNRPNMT